VRPTSAEEEAWALHETFLEVLRRLNQAEEEREELTGLELTELERVMQQFWTSRSGAIALDRAVDLLVENGLVATTDDPAYSWVRNRTVGRRYTITTLGKTYLVRQIDESGRIR
jgi:hypothetical protein